MLHSIYMCSTFSHMCFHLLWPKLQTLVLLGHEHVHSGLFTVESKVRFGLGHSSATILHNWEADLSHVNVTLVNLRITNAWLLTWYLYFLSFSCRQRAPSSGKQSPHPSSYSHSHAQQVDEGNHSYSQFGTPKEDQRMLLTTTANPVWRLVLLQHLKVNSCQQHENSCAWYSFCKI